MKCKVVKEYLPFYYYNELDKKTISEIKSHIKSCRNCRTEFKFLKGTLKLVDKEERVKLPLAYRRTLLNKILQAANLKEEKAIFARKRALVFSSGLAIVLILFFSLFFSLRVPHVILDWEDNSFTYKLEELEESIAETDEMISGEITQLVEEYSLDEKIDNIYEEIEELTVFLSI